MKKLLKFLWFKLIHTHKFEEELGYGITRIGIGSYNYKACKCGKIKDGIYNFKKDPEMYNTTIKICKNFFMGCISAVLTCFRHIIMFGISVL